MASLWALFSLLYRVGLLVVAVVFTVQTSRGDAALKKAGKFLGLIVSILPIIGILFYVGFKGRPSGYGERCGVMALLGALLYAVTLAGGTLR